MGLLDKLGDGLAKLGIGRADHAARKQAQAEYIAILDTVIADGDVSPSEKRRINDHVLACELDPDFVLQANEDAYIELLVHDQIAGRTSAADNARLAKVRSALRLDTDVERRHAPAIAHRARIGMILSGQAPALGHVPLNLKSGETPFAVQAAELIEERVVDRRITGASVGISIPVVKGIRLRFGQGRGHLESIRGNVAVARGHLVITDQRIAFSGDKKSFDVTLSRVIDVRQFSDGLIIAINGAANRMVRFVGEVDNDVISACIASVISR